jgi:hypothetical protein
MAHAHVIVSTYTVFRSGSGLGRLLPVIRAATWGWAPDRHLGPDGRGCHARLHRPSFFARPHAGSLRSNPHDARLGSTPRHKTADPRPEGHCPGAVATGVSPAQACRSGTAKVKPALIPKTVEKLGDKPWDRFLGWRRPRIIVRRSPDVQMSLIGPTRAHLSGTQATAPPRCRAAVGGTRGEGGARPGGTRVPSAKNW